MHNLGQEKKVLVQNDESNCFLGIPLWHQSINLAPGTNFLEVNSHYATKISKYILKIFCGCKLENINKTVEESHQVCYTCIFIYASVNTKGKVPWDHVKMILLGFRKNVFGGGKL